MQRYLFDRCLKALVLGFLLGVLISVCYIFPREARAEMIDPIGKPAIVSFENLPSRTVQETVAGKPTVSEVKAYLRSIFGSKANLAWAIAQNECNSSRKEWPVCVNSWGDNPNRGEHSVGLFQINIARAEGKGAKVHWDKIPAGNTLGEKEVWLSDWKNNILTAYVVSQGGMNWTPWSAYLSGAYRKDL